MRRSFTFSAIVLLFQLFCWQASGQNQFIREYHKVELSDTEIAVLVRGNISSGKLLLFVQGGPGETAIDFARADYPRWKNSLEQKTAIAYYDQRGLNQKVKQIDSSKINFEQYGKDLIALAKYLHHYYEVSIYLLGHSAGGYILYQALADIKDPEYNIAGAITLNTPLTTDFSPERYRDYRPLYLENLAREMMSKKIDSTYWRQALRWMQVTDSIHNRETSEQWNRYVSSAFVPAKRKIGPFRALGTIISRPYGLFSYPYKKDDELVGDLLWHDERNLDLTKILPRVKHPVLVLTGRYDDIAPPEEIIRVQSLLPNSIYAIIPDAAHESYLDNPEVVNAEILEFMGLN